MERIALNGLIVESTRRCQMACPHCLRGNAQWTDLDHAYIDSILNQTQLINTLFITGGEPLLVTDTLQYIADGMIDRGIPLMYFVIYTNGLLYDKKFVQVVELFRKIIDISCTAGFAKDKPYNPAEETYRCYVGVSLDKFHEQHATCEANYLRYKAALKGKADVLKIMRGNAPLRIGRAACLSDVTYGRSNLHEYSFLRRVEVLSKDHIPICRNYNTFRLADENQKKVCCNLYLSVDGVVRHGIVSDNSYDDIDKFPQICRVEDNIWAGIQQYNIGRLSCGQIATEKIKVNRHDYAAIADTIVSKFTFPSDAQDEQSSKEKLNLLQTIIKAANDGVKTQKELNTYLLMENINNAINTGDRVKDWKQLAKESAAFFRGGKQAAQLTDDTEPP